MVKATAKGVLILVAVMLSMLGTGHAHAQPPEPPDTSESADGGICESVPEWAQDISILPGGIGEDLATIGNACSAGTAVADPAGTAGEVVDWAASGAVGEAAESFLEGFGQAVNLMFTWWLDIPLPELANPESVGVFHSYFYWFNASLLAVSITVAGVRLAAANAASREQRATEAAKVLVRTVFATATFAPGLVATHAGMVAMGRWIVDEAAGGNVVEVLGNLFDVSKISNTLAAGLILIFAVLGIVGALVQAVFIVVQYAMLILVVGFLPTAAAGSATAAGNQSFKKMLGFSLATVLFPLLSCGVYAVALWSAGGDDAMSILCGMALLALSCLCLPVLVRLIVPAVAASGGASGASALGGIAIGTGAAAGVAMKVASPGAGGQSAPSSSATGGQSPDRPTGAMTNPPATPGPRGGPGGAGTGGAAGAAGSAGAAGAGKAAAGGAMSGAATVAAGPAGAIAAGAKAGAKAVSGAVQTVERATGSAAGDGERDPHGPTGGRSR